MHELQTLTLAELAEALKVSRWTVRRLVDRDPSFPKPVRVGQQKRWRCTQVRAWMAGIEQAADTPERP